MEIPKTPAATLDLIAKAQLALVHAAVVSPTFDWETLEQLVRLWQKTNARRYLAQGHDLSEVATTLRMIFRDYVHEVRAEDAAEADRLRQALSPFLDT